MLTNKRNLPKPFVEAVTRLSSGVPGNISISQLTDAPQIRALRKKHTVQDDVSDRMFLMENQAIYYMLEKANTETYAEECLKVVTELFKGRSTASGDHDIKIKYAKVAEFLENEKNALFANTEKKYLWGKTFTLNPVDGMTVYGEMDLYDIATKTLYDYRRCSTWAYVYPESREKWRLENNVLAAMMRENGIEVDSIRTIALFKDFNAKNKALNKDYPEHSIIEIPVTIAEHSKVMEYITNRANSHKLASEGEVVECTGRERWAKADEWAVTTPGRAKVMKRFVSPQLAEDYRVEQLRKSPTAYVIHRPGQSSRCEEWCPVKDFCPQRKAELESLAKNAEASV